MDDGAGTAAGEVTLTLVNDSQHEELEVTRLDAAGHRDESFKAV